ncbi:MAG TPA: fibrinogen-like YCDxxxxGGGW domain-containing protein [Kofleriaceae bacterium]|nr:fibrinogen-like YCDxxxxGGGW domain-containing protein [Kofleriaceae bacterium]
MRGLVVAAMLVTGCTSIGGGGGDDDGVTDDAAPDVTVVDGAPGPDDDADPDALGSVNNPAQSCVELRDAGAGSGAYWVLHPDMEGAALKLYCEQERGGGGWVLLYSSVLTEGETTAFFQIAYADRFEVKGEPDPAANYYNGALYAFGTEYMDVIRDLADTTVVAARVDVEGFDEGTMAFVTPTLVAGNSSIFNSQFGAGWASADHDGDTNADNCSSIYCGIAQHYSSCWSYNLGCDAPATEDAGLGPHVNDTVMTAMGLALQPASNGYSRVKRIARFTRW